MYLKFTRTWCDVTCWWSCWCTCRTCAGPDMLGDMTARLNTYRAHAKCLSMSGLPTQSRCQTVRSAVSYPSLLTWQAGGLSYAIHRASISTLGPRQPNTWALQATSSTHQPSLPGTSRSGAALQQPTGQEEQAKQQMIAARIEENRKRRAQRQFLVCVACGIGVASPAAMHKHMKTCCPDLVAEAEWQQVSNPWAQQHMHTLLHPVAAGRQLPLSCGALPSSCWPVFAHPWQLAACACHLLCGLLVLARSAASATTRHTLPWCLPCHRHLIRPLLITA